MVTGSLESFPSDSGYTAGDALDRVPTHRNSHIQSHSTDNSETPIRQYISLDWGRKPLKNRESMHTQSNPGGVRQI